MKIQTAEFKKGIRGTNPILDDGIPQVAFVGRSNVGKSSVINSLLNRKNLVKSSSVPGKTREINFFLVNEEMYFVDLPGYGFARMAPKMSEKLKKLIWWYLSSGEAKPKLVVLLVDAKVGLTELDMEMLGILKEFNHKVLVVANKSDKLKKNDLKKRLGEIEDVVKDGVIMYSAKKQTNRSDLLNKIFSV